MAKDDLPVPRKILLRDLNEHLICSLCSGYFIDATTLIDCLHTFCRACIVRHLESSRTCPNCRIGINKNKPLTALRSDPTVQAIVFKVVPSLYSKEIQRRADFYHSTGFRANSSCSDDSVLGKGAEDNEEWVLANIGDPSTYFSPDDSISLSLEYYNPELDKHNKCNNTNDTNNTDDANNISSPSKRNNTDNLDNTSNVDNENQTSSTSHLQSSTESETSASTVITENKDTTSDEPVENDMISIKSSAFKNDQVQSSSDTFDVESSVVVNSGFRSEGSLTTPSEIDSVFSEHISETSHSVTNLSAVSHLSSVSSISSLSSLSHVSHLSSISGTSSLSRGSQLSSLSEVPSLSHVSHLSSVASGYSISTSIGTSLPIVASRPSDSSRPIVSSMEENVISSPPLTINSSNMRSLTTEQSSPTTTDSYRRYLQCPAAVTMEHLQKFLRMKNGLSENHKVDIIYNGEILPRHFQLMDVAYSYNWKRNRPLRLFYRIFMPIPVQATRLRLPSPPRAVGAISPPIIQVEKSSETKTSDKSDKNCPVDSPKIKESKSKDVIKSVESKDSNNRAVQKSVKFIDPKTIQKPAKLDDPKSIQKPAKLDDYKPVQKSVKFFDSSSKSSDATKAQSEYKKPYENCIYDYTEPDKDEIKEFAERRDREWALQKHADSEIHVSKKRKKNKHSKNEFMHKKRKLHAEITSNEVLSKSEDSLKLKVKLSVANGHKHKHRNNSSSSSNTFTNLEPLKTQELSPKERLLQMRQVRHKNITPQASDEKTKNNGSEHTYKIVQNLDKIDKLDDTSKTPSAERTPDILTSGKTLRSDFSIKTSISKDICNKYVSVNLEKCIDPKGNVQRKSPVNSNLKNDTTIQSIDTKKMENVADAKNDKKSDQKNSEKNNLTITEAKREQKSSEPKTAESRNVPKLNDKLADLESTEKKNTIDVKSSTSTTLVTKNFTVSKVEQGVKRKLEPDQQTQDKRPSLEITLINPRPQTSGTQTKPSTPLKPSGTQPKPGGTQTKPNTQQKPSGTQAKPSGTQSKPSGTQSKPSGTQPKPNNTQAKPTDGKVTKTTRPPPPTIPLVRIQKSLSLKSGISIIPSKIEKCDIFGALDLSAKPNKPDVKISDFRATAGANTKVQDRIQNMIRPKTPIKNLPSETKPNAGEKSELIPNMSNLQMLSEAAVREMMVKNSSTTLPIPNLIKKTPSQTLKIPVPQNSGLKSPNSIPKSNFSPKTPNLVPKTPTTIPKNLSVSPKTPNLVSKSLTLIPKSPSILTKPSTAPKTPNLIPKTSTVVAKSPSVSPKCPTAFAKNPNFPKGPNFLPKTLQKLPKLNEINKNQFCRINNTPQIRLARPAGQNQTIRNIPNPSLLVRQQNQNRINSMNTNSANVTNSSNTETKQDIGSQKTDKPETNKEISAPGKSETDKKGPEIRNSEPPALKAIDIEKK